MALAGMMLLLVGSSLAASPPKAIVTVLIDDLGSYDTAVNNPDIAWLTPNLRKLSHEGGLQLSRFYVNKYCSPTRRAFLTGRFPVSVSMMQAQPCDNTLPLEATLLSEKLKQAPVRCQFFPTRSSAPQHEHEERVCSPRGYSFVAHPAARTNPTLTNERSGR